MPKVLVVDDEKSIRALCAEELGEEGYEVITTGQGKGVLGLIDSARPSVVIATGWTCFRKYGKPTRISRLF